MSFTWWRYPTRRFSVDGLSIAVASHARSDGLFSVLTLNGVEQARDQTPFVGPESVRNHRLRTTLPDGRQLEVDFGYIGVWTTGAVVRLDNVVIYESHAGQVPSYPEKYRENAVKQKTIRESMAAARGEGPDPMESGVLAPHNRLPFAVDVVTGLLFYAIAKLTDLQTAALVGIAVGFGLVAFQRITKIDVTGGLALFGIVMLCISAGLALLLADSEWIKLRGTMTGLIAASFFLLDGARGGRYIGKGLTRFMPYADLNTGRLAIGMGSLGLVMAALNYAAAKLLTTDNWLLYTTFVDIFIVMGLAYFVVRFARGAKVQPDA